MILANLRANMEFYVTEIQGFPFLVLGPLSHDTSDPDACCNDGDPDDQWQGRTARGSIHGTEKGGEIFDGPGVIAHARLRSFPDDRQVVVGAGRTDRAVPDHRAV